MREYGVDPRDLWGSARERPEVWKAHNPADLAAVLDP
jgi:hypothetical protein